MVAGTQTRAAARGRNGGTGRKTGVFSHAARGLDKGWRKEPPAAKTLPRWKKMLMALVGLGVGGCAVQAAAPAMMPQPQAVMYIVDPAARPDGRFAAGDAGVVDAWPLRSQRLPAVVLDLQRCADASAAALKMAQGDGFHMLRFNTEGLIDQRGGIIQVGSQPVAAALDGEGTWYGTREYRRVTFHCLQDPEGRVVYSFVRPQ